MQIRSIKTRLSIIFGVLILFICSGLGFIGCLLSEKALTDSINESLPNLAKEASTVVQERIGSQLNALEVLAESDFIKSDKVSINKKLEILKIEVQRANHLWMTIVDADGNAITTKGGVANVADLAYFKTAKSGKRAVSDPFKSKITNDVVLAYAVPIKDGERVKGALVSVRDGNELSERISDIRFSRSGEANIINNSGTCIAHKDKNLVITGYNAIEKAKKDSGLASLVELHKKMIEGKAGVGEYTFNGITKYMGYAPIEGTNWALSITAPRSEVMKEVDNLLKTVTIISIIILIISLAITYFIASGISKPIKKASEYLKVVATGDFTKHVPVELLKAKDETGILINAINAMQTSIRKILKEVVNESSFVSGMLNSVNINMEQLNKGIEEISSITEEMSAGSEEIASSTEEMSATSTEIERAVESIASKAQEGAVVVNKVSKMAEKMKQNAIISKENAVEIYESTKNSLQKAIEQSKKVKQINELAEGILTITSQTNLLALNAAIESARAGEAGKGFAVVADEIKKLAEDSKNMVTRIQEVTNVILEAVNNLSISSGEILEFIDKKVLSDYDTLVEASEKYSENSFNIDSMVSDFSATSEELLASVHSMVRATEEIASSANEEAKGTVSIAQETEEIMNKSNETINLSESAKEKSNTLIQVVSKFKI